MKNITVNFLALLLTSGVVHAGIPCNGFEIKIKNNTSDDLLVMKKKLSGASLQPQGVQIVPKHSEQVFTVNGSIGNEKLEGILKFNSVSIPIKNANIEFNLKNKRLICENKSVYTSGDYPINYTRLPGQVSYTIG